MLFPDFQPRHYFPVLRVLSDLSQFIQKPWEGPNPSGLMARCVTYAPELRSFIMVSSRALGVPGSASVVTQPQDWGGAQAPSELASSSMGCLSVSRRSRAFEAPHTRPLRTARCLTLVGLYVDCLPSVCPQEDVYLATTQQLVEGVVSGYNATVFAYGPSGTARAVSWEGGREVGGGGTPHSVTERVLPEGQRAPLHLAPWALQQP